MMLLLALDSNGSSRRESDKVEHDIAAHNWSLVNISSFILVYYRLNESIIDEDEG
jgi:hypothetical protein